MEDIVDGATTIALRRKTKQRLALIGRKGQTFDDLVSFLLKNFEGLK